MQGKTAKAVTALHRNRAPPRAVGVVLCENKRRAVAEQRNVHPAVGRMHIQSRLGGSRPAMVASLWDPMRELGTNR